MAPTLAAPRSCRNAFVNLSRLTDYTDTCACAYFNFWHAAF